MNEQTNFTSGIIANCRQNSSEQSWSYS